MRISRGVAAAVVAAAISISGACRRGPDPSPDVEKALQQANLDNVKVNWDHDAHVAHLTGTVNAPGDRQRAEEVAAAAVGTSGRVLNELTIKGVNDKTAGDLDGDIRSTLKKMIDNDPALKERDVKVEVNNGVVTLKGDVRTAAEKSRLTELLRAAPGVKDFANAVEIKPAQ